MRISRQALGVAGAGILALGVFAPIVRMPLVGSMNYLRRGDPDGAIVLVLAGVALGLALAKKYRLILLPAALSLGAIGYTFVDIQVRLHDAKAALDDLGPLRPLGALAVDAIQIQWGWAVMLAGVVLLGIAALLREEQKSGEIPADGAS